MRVNVCLKWVMDKLVSVTKATAAVVDTTPQWHERCMYISIADKHISEQQGHGR